MDLSPSSNPINASLVHNNHEGVSLKQSNLICFSVNEIIGVFKLDFIRFPTATRHHLNYLKYNCI